MLSPSKAYSLGADELVRGVFSRLLHGGRISFLVSAGVVTISFTTGDRFDRYQIAEPQG